MGEGYRVKAMSWHLPSIASVPFKPGALAEQPSTFSIGDMHSHQMFMPQHVSLMICLAGARATDRGCNCGNGLSVDHSGRGAAGCCTVHAGLCLPVRPCLCMPVLKTTANCHILGSPCCRLCRNSIAENVRRQDFFSPPHAAGSAGCYASEPYTLRSTPAYTHQHTCIPRADL